MSINYNATPSSGNILDQINQQTVYYTSQALNENAEKIKLEKQLPALKEKLKEATDSGDQQQIFEAQMAVEQIKQQIAEHDSNIFQYVHMAGLTMELFKADTSN